MRLVPGGGEHVHLPLNRALRPLGVAARRRRVRLRDHRAQAVVFRTDPRTSEGVWFDPAAGAAPGLPRRRLLLHGDTPESRMDHFARLGRLMARVSRLCGATGP